MKLNNLVRFSSLAAALAAAGWAQTQIDLSTQAKAVNFSTLPTLPSQTGTALPSTCQVGATFILTTSLAGQNWYICTSNNQWTLEGSTPPPGGNAGGVLSTDGTSLFWNVLSGDISGAAASISVNKLLGRPLNTAAPATGQLLEWDGLQWSPHTFATPVTSVFGRIGVIAAQTGDYSFAQISGSVSSNQLPLAGGDLSGAITSATVTRVQSWPVSATAPATGQVLTWSGSQWAPQTPTGGGGSGGAVASVFGRSGAVTAQTGDYAAAQVTNAVDFTRANAYVAGARQTFNTGANGAGIQLAPAPLPSAPIAGDMAVDSGDSNRMKVYSGSAWVTLSQVTPASNYTASFTSALTVAIPGTTHNLGTGNLIVQCYDNSSPANMVEPSLITVDPVTYNVTVAFASAETGHCVLNGYSGSSGGSGSSGSSGSSGGAGMSSQLGDFAVVFNSATALSIGGNCSLATPCNVRFGTQTYSITSSASATIVNGSGTAFVYVDATGTLTIGGAMTLTCNSSCVIAPGITGFPVNTVPVYTWTALNGAWNSTGGVDRRGWLSASPVLGGPGIAAVTTAGETTIAVDSAVVPTYLTASATLTFPLIAAGACTADLSFSLPGANAGDAVAPGWPAALAAGLSGTMRISASGVVAVRLCADTTGAVTPVPATFTATVVRGF